MFMTSVTINKPMNNIFEPTLSAVSERLRSITAPSHYSIIRKDFSSVTEPNIIMEVEDINIPTEDRELKKV